jgi:ABC-type proline/glycine betaine transport system substrate-binding protein
LVISLPSKFQWDKKHTFASIQWHEKGTNNKKAVNSIKFKSYNVVENVKDASSPKGTLNKRAKEWIKNKLLL